MHELYNGPLGMPGGAVTVDGASDVQVIDSAVVCANSEALDINSAKNVTINTNMYLISVKGSIPVLLKSSQIKLNWLNGHLASMYGCGWFYYYTDTQTGRPESKYLPDGEFNIYSVDESDNLVATPSSGWIYSPYYL